MLALLWNLISRVFVFILLGYLIDRILEEKGETVTRVFVAAALYGLIPLFVFLSLWNNMLPVTDAGKLTVAAVLVTGAGALLTWLWARATKRPFRCLCLPVIFMNSAYLAIPVNTLLWGGEGAAATILYNLAITVLIFTFGIWCVSRQKALSEILELPVIYAVALGLLLHFLAIAPPRAAVIAGDIVSRITLPVMLMFVGYRLKRMPLSRFGVVLTGTAFRMVGGLAAGIGAVYLLGLSGVLAGVCVMTSLMPTAVNSYILAEQFNADAELAAAVVFLGTVVSFFLIPAAVYVLRFIP